MSFAKVQSSARNCKAHHIFLVAISMHSDPLSPSHNSAILKAARVFISTGVMGVTEHSADSRLFLFLYRCQAWVGGVFQPCSGTKVLSPHQRSEIVPFLTIYSSVSSLRVSWLNLCDCNEPNIVVSVLWWRVPHHWNDMWTKGTQKCKDQLITIVVYITGGVSSFLNMCMSDICVSALCWCGELLPITKTSVHILIVLILDKRLTWKTMSHTKYNRKYIYINTYMTIWIRFLLGVLAEILVSGCDSAFSRQFRWNDASSWTVMFALTSSSSR